MDKLVVKNNGRKYIVRYHSVVYVRPTLFGKRAKKDRRGYDTPDDVEFLIGMITEIVWSEGWFLASPSLTITCSEGHNDPWRTSKGERSWKLKFGSDDEDRARNRALVLAWLLHLAAREEGRHVLKGPLPGRPNLMPTRKEEAAIKALEHLAKTGDWLGKMFERFVTWVEGRRGGQAE